MKKANRKRRSQPELLREYDFRGGVRGKYAARLARGSNIVVLDPDIAEIFPTSAAVSSALRTFEQMRQSMLEANHLRRRRAG